LVQLAGYFTVYMDQHTGNIKGTPVRINFTATSNLLGIEMIIYYRINCKWNIPVPPCTKQNISGNQRYIRLHGWIRKGQKQGKAAYFVIQII
jgi:hypothetical protein